MNTLGQSVTLQTLAENPDQLYKTNKKGQLEAINFFSFAVEWIKGGFGACFLEAKAP